MDAEHSSLLHPQQSEDVGGFNTRVQDPNEEVNKALRKDLEALGGSFSDFLKPRKTFVELGDFT